MILVFLVSHTDPCVFLVLIIILSQGQLKLHRAAVAVVGAGGLGCPALQYLGASGIGTEDESLTQPFSTFYFI